MQKKPLNLRLAIVCMAAASVGLSMAIVSISKLLLFACGLSVLIFARRTNDVDTRLSGLFTPYAVLAAIFAFAVSLLWTLAPEADALAIKGSDGETFQ